MTLVLATGNHLYSTLYGWAGSKEVRAKMRRLRLGREVLRYEGHPTDEHLELSVNKTIGLRNAGVEVLDRRAFLEMQDAKAAQKDAPPAPAIVVDPRVDDFDRSFTRQRNEKQRSITRRQKIAEKEAAFA